MSEKTSALIIQASNIHEGGGRVLLLSLIKSLIEQEKIKPQSLQRRTTIFVDSRFQLKKEVMIEDLTAFSIEEVKATILSRLWVEFKIYRLSKQKNVLTTLFCFGNLPPLFPVGSSVILYFHTVLYFKEFSQKAFRWPLRIKLFIERCWLMWAIHRVNCVYVQSSFVNGLFKKNFLFEKVKVFPFLPESFFNQFASTSEKLIKSHQKYDFIYPALGTPHKNHNRLIEAWNLLAEKNIYPTLVLTVEGENTELLRLIEHSVAKFHTKIVNLGRLPHSDIVSLYQQSRALIFPSRCESFGLPLLEADFYKLDIISSETDFVRDLVQPCETFDPGSSLSICRAVLRYLNIPFEKPFLDSVQKFVNEVLS